MHWPQYELQSVFEGALRDREPRLSAPRYRAEGTGHAAARRRSSP